MSDITKLPKWAQQKINLIQGQLEHAKKHLDKTGRLLEYGEPGVGYSCGMQSREIPSNLIRFVNKAGVQFDVHLMDNGILDINISGTHYNQVPVVLPRASNSVWIATLDERTGQKPSTK